MATPRDYAAEAQRIFDRIRANLLQSLQPGNARAFAQGNPRENLTHRSPFSNVGQGISLPAGRMPSDAQIAAIAQQDPAYRRAIKKMRAAGQSGKDSRSGQVSSTVRSSALSQPSQPSAGMALFNAYYNGVRGDFEEAKAANLARYDEGKKELTGTRDFRQQKYENFGTAAQQDIDERLSETLKRIKAQAASRGLSNSNVPLAFEQRAARDTAREQQRVRETRDARLADAYAQDTGNLVGFIERREDPYPDVNQALQMGIQLSESEANRQADANRLQMIQEAYRGTGGRGRSDVRLPPLPGPQGGVMPMFTNGTPLQMANAQFGGMGWQRGITSNRYPTRRSPEEYAAQEALSAQQAQQADMEMWLKRRRMFPTYQPPTPGYPIPSGPPQGPAYA